MSVVFYIPEKIISIENKDRYRNYPTIIFSLYNKTYTSITTTLWGYNIVTNSFYYESCIHNYNHRLIIKFFDNVYSSGFEITKNNEKKRREFIKIPSILYNTLYAFFIYSKYYTIYDNIKDYNTLETIYTYKLFNCYDLYRIVAFI